MKREFLKGLGLADEIIEQIMMEHGKVLQAEQNKASEKEGKISTLEAERDGLKEQLTAANGQIEKFKGAEMDIETIRKEAGEWKEKAEAAEREATAKMEAQAYEFAVKEYLGGHKFASEMAKKAALADLLEQKFPMKDGAILGADDYMEKLKESDPGAFQSDESAPAFTRGGTNGGGEKITREQLKGMGYAERLKLKSEQPELYNALAGKE